MIGYLHGTIHRILPNGKDIIVLTSGGVGYRVMMGNTSLFSLFEEIEVYVLTVVREDALDLYGFVSEDERELCELLTTVSGVGPKTSLNIMSATSPQILADAITQHNSQYLATLPGIGKKGAEKIILELSEKTKKLSFAHKAATSIESDLMEALLAMGYQPRHISEIISQHQFSSTNLGDRIRESLNLLNK